MHFGKVSGERKLILQRYLSKQEAESNITSLEAKRLKKKSLGFDEINLQKCFIKRE